MTVAAKTFGKRTPADNAQAAQPLGNGTGHGATERAIRHLQAIDTDVLTRQLEAKIARMISVRRRLRHTRDR